MEAVLKEAMREMRIALIEADVSLEVIKEFITNVEKEALGKEVIKSVSATDMIIKIVYDAIINILEEKDSKNTKLNIETAKRYNILMLGLQGSGKTTLCAKLAHKIRKEHNKKDETRILLVSLDSYRPAAKQQLEILAKNANVFSLPIIEKEKPIATARRSLDYIKDHAFDVVIYDTAGRMQIDEVMINEAKEIKELVSPDESILVIDSLIGQESVNIAKIFNQEIGVDSCALSRIDGDGRGGAALSIKYATSVPIKFLSTGENIADLDYFDPSRIASRIVDKGDIISLVEKASEVVDKEEAEKAAKKMQKGRFDLDDYLSQISNMQKMGGLGKILKMLPGSMANKIGGKIDEDTIKKQQSIIFSMTKKERKKPALLNMARKQRIARGSGNNIVDVNKLLKQFQKIQSMMKKMGKMDPAILQEQMKKFM
ncbi:MAG TPA: signal recognition particle protein [Candidatus Megaira endosymbiont of Hartmannula sinica]|nr:signal recognition particle protein [Candidatus Megaera endosymbiont of Hartmannula sinica]